MSTIVANTPGKEAPGPRGEWLVGNMRDFRRDSLGTLAQSFATYGDIVKFKLGGRVLHMVAHPELAQEVLIDRSSEFVKMPKHQGLGLMLGNGLITNDNHESWLTQRRMMQPMFHRQRLVAMGDKMVAAGERMIGRWQAWPDGETVNIAEEMMQVTLDIITQTMFSADVLSEAGRVGPAVATTTHFVSKRGVGPIQLPVSWPTPNNRAFRQATQTLDEIVYRLINQRRAEGTTHGDLLDMLLEARDADNGESMSNQQLRDEVLTIFAAGHETTANTLSWAWYMLAQHPEVMARLQAELDSVLEGRTPTIADLPNLPYTQQVFNEVLRLYPAAPSIPRLVPRETTLRGYTLPAKSMILLSIYNIQRHPEFWSDPNTFNPDRWAGDNHKRQHRLAFMPFSAGPRICIGNNLALMEGQLLLAMVAQYADLRLVPGQQVKPEVAVTMRPKDGLQMTIHPRH
ncbi:MAG: cytochrome P450 [Chloroflexi bacterium]|nr:cytochrome P450 [Chloroflexota bacterium]